jgi:AAA15 family ATPase/GTPase
MNELDEVIHHDLMRCYCDCLISKIQTNYYLNLMMTTKKNGASIEI